MSDFVQLDLFGDRPNIDRPPNAASLQSLLPHELSDEGLISALPEATLADACALAAEAGTRRLSAAHPAQPWERAQGDFAGRAAHNQL